MRALKGINAAPGGLRLRRLTDERTSLRGLESAYDVVRVAAAARRAITAVFFRVGEESLSLYFERNPADPRVTTVDLEFGPVGECVRPRRWSTAACRRPVAARQVRAGSSARISRYSRGRLYRRYRPGLPQPAYRLRAPCESRGYEITGVAPAADLFTRDGARRPRSPAAAQIAYAAVADRRPRRSACCRSEPHRFPRRRARSAAARPMGHAGPRPRDLSPGVHARCVATNYAGQ